MGWNEDIDEAQRVADLAVREQEAAAARARKAGMDPDTVGFIRSMSPAMWNVRKREFLGMIKDAEEAATRKAKDDDDASPRTAPEGMPDDAKEVYEDPDTTDAEAAAIKEIFDPATAEADPFQLEEWSASGGALRDRFSLDVGEDVSPQSYATYLLQETPDDPRYTAQTGSSFGRSGRRHVGVTKGITPQKYVARVNSMSPDDLEAFQRDLYAAGFYGSVSGGKDAEPIWRAPDEPTIAATKLLAYTTMRFGGKYSIVETLDLFRKRADANNDGVPDSEEKEKPKPVVRLTNPLDVQAAAQQQSVDLMGRRLAPDQLGGVAGGYGAMEASYQTASQMAEIDNTGGTFTAPASPSAFTEAKIREEFAPEVDSFTYLSIINALSQRLGLAG